MKTIEELKALSRNDLVKAAVEAGIANPAKEKSDALIEAILTVQAAAASGNGDKPDEAPKDDAPKDEILPTHAGNPFLMALTHAFEAIKNLFAVKEAGAYEPVDADTIVSRWEWASKVLRRSPATAMDKHGWWKLELNQGGGATLTKYAQVPYHARRPEHRNNTHDVVIVIDDVPEFLVLLTSGYLQGSEIIEADELAMQDEEAGIQRQRLEESEKAEAANANDQPDPIMRKLSEIVEHFGLAGIPGDSIVPTLSSAIGVTQKDGESASDYCTRLIETFDDQKAKGLC